MIRPDRIKPVPNIRSDPFEWLSSLCSFCSTKKSRGIPMAAETKQYRADAVDGLILSAAAREKKSANSTLKPPNKTTVTF